MADTLLGNLVWRITGDTKDFDKKLSTTDTGITNTTKKGIASFKNFATGIGVAIAALVGLKAISDKLEDAYAAQAEAVALLDSTLKATGASAWTSSQQLQDFATQLQSITLYGDETITSMQNVLLGFKNIKGDNFYEASVQILNMATVMKMDLTSAAQAVGKALDDPIAGIDALSRQGFRFTKEQKEMLKVMVQTGDIAGAQKIILDELATTYGGAAEAAAKTSTALKVQLSNALGDVAEQAGRWLSETAAPIRAWLTELATRTASSAQNLFNQRDATKALAEAEKAYNAGSATTEQKLLFLESAANNAYDAWTKGVKDVNDAQTLLKSNPNDKYTKDFIAFQKELNAQNLKAADAYEKELNAVSKLSIAERKKADADAEQLIKDIEAEKIRQALADETARKDAEQIAGRKEALASYQKAVAIATDKTNIGLITEREEREAIASAAQTQIDALYELGYSAAEVSSLGGQEIVKMIDLIKTLKVTGKDYIEESTGLWDGWAENAGERMEKLYTVGMDSLMTGFSDIGSAIAQNSLDWKVFAKSGLNALAAIIEAMGHELLAQAAKSVAFSWSTFGASLVGVAPALSGAAAAYTASGLIKGYAGAFEQGGIVPGTSYTGDKMVASVNSGEEILRRDDPRNSLNGGGSSTIVIQLDGRTIAQSTVNLVNNGEYLIKGGSII